MRQATTTTVFLLCELEKNLRSGDANLVATPILAVTEDFGTSLGPPSHSTVTDLTSGKENCEGASELTKEIA